MAQLSARKGSVLLSVVILLTFLMLFLKRGLDHLSLSCDIVASRSRYYKQFYLAETVLHEGVKKAISSFMPACYTVAVSDYRYQATVVIDAMHDKRKLLVTASLLGRDRPSPLFVLRCIVHKAPRGARKEKGGCFIDGYTISAFV